MKMNLETICKRAAELADMDMDSLRATYPVETETRSECIKYCKDLKLSRGTMIHHILFEEFDDTED